MTDDFERVNADVKTFFVTCGRDQEFPAFYMFQLIST
jgi:hypothetical protein